CFASAVPLLSSAFLAAISSAFLAAISSAFLAAISSASWQQSHQHSWQQSHQLHSAHMAPSFSIVQNMAAVSSSCSLNSNSECKTPPLHEYTNIYAV
ncbi:unnamed protein product, partial [Staurois parvus]